MSPTRITVAALGFAGITACAGQQQAEPRSGQSASCAEQLKKARVAVDDMPSRPGSADKSELNLYLWEAQQALDNKDEQTCWKNLGKVQTDVNF